MKKTVTVNISGIIFHIDDDAYERLGRYMDRIKRYFTKSDGRDEIIGDIEGRIAEILQGKINESKQVITIEDINEVIANMGEPADFDESGDTETSRETMDKNYQPTRPKRLYRDPDNKTIAGVATGLAAYFNIDPVWIKILFLITAISYGPGIIVYIILWIAVPEARTTAEKLEMRGEQVNISNIERSIRDEFDGIKGRVNNFAEEAGEIVTKKRPVVKTFINNLINLIGTIIGYFFKFVVVMAGIVLMLSGFAFVIILLATITGLYDFSFFENGEMIGFSIPVFLEMIFSSHFMTFLAIVSVALLLGIPIILMIYLGFRLMLGNRAKVKYFGRTALAFWLVGLILAAYVGVFTGRDFRHTGRLTKDYELPLKPAKVLYIDCLPESTFSEEEPHFQIFDKEWKVIFKENDYQIYGLPKIRFAKSKTNAVKIGVTSYAKGSDREEAERRAEACLYPVNSNDSTFILPNYFKLPKNEIIRAQQIKMVIEMPEGQIVKFNQNMENLFFDNPYGNFENIDYPGKTYIMTENGLMPYVEGAEKKDDQSKTQNFVMPENDLPEMVIFENLSTLSINANGI
jgi:phage shock protein PspC (stress-responsive transcriptional regulator)